MRTWILSAALIIGLLALPTYASAAECEGVTYPESITVDGQKLVLNGMGLRTATILNVKVFVAALYVPKVSRSSKELLDPSVPKRVVLTFVRNVSHNKVAGAYQENLDRAPDDIRESIRPDYELLISRVVPVKKGDTNVFTYIPGTGLQIETVGKLRATITNPDMIQYFLGLYMGPTPNYQQMRDGLVTGKCP